MPGYRCENCKAQDELVPSEGDKSEDSIQSDTTIPSDHSVDAISPDGSVYANESPIKIVGNPLQESNNQQSKKRHLLDNDPSWYKSDKLTEKEFISRRKKLMEETEDVGSTHEVYSQPIDHILRHPEQYNTFVKMFRVSL